MSDAVIRPTVLASIGAKADLPSRVAGILAEQINEQERQIARDRQRLAALVELMRVEAMDEEEGRVPPAGDP